MLQLGTDILGQQKVIDALSTAIQAGRVPHAYLFQGPKGVGKYTTAEALGTLLLCQSPTTTLTGEKEACGVCDSCLLFAGERDQETNVPNHPDFHVVRKELARFSDNRQIRERKLTAIPVEVLRDHFLDHVYRAAQMTHGKVFVIDEADLLSITGQNLILKTLEEPPESTYIILISDKPDKVLPTIRSRVHCQQFWPLETKVVGEWLTRRMMADAEKTPMPEENELSWAAEFARGSLGRSLLAIEYELFAWHQRLGAILNELKHGIFQAEMIQDIQMLQEGFVESWLKKQPKASKEAVNKEAFGLLCEMLSQLIHHYCRQDWEKHGPIYVTCIQAIRDAQTMVERNVKLNMVLEKLLLDCRLELSEAV